jgi:hypothetical protein
VRLLTLETIAGPVLANFRSRACASRLGFRILSDGLARKYSQRLKLPTDHNVNIVRDDHSGRPSEDTMYDREHDADKAKTTDSVMSAAQDAVQELADPLKEKALEVAKEKKDAGADQLQLLARAMHGASEAVEDDVPHFAGYIKNLSGSLEKVSADIRERDLDELGQTMSAFAKRNPALVFSGAILAGLALSRFLKSSSAPFTRTS